MNPPQSIRIALLLVVIFAAGIVTGRLTMRQPTLVQGPGGRFLTAETALQRLKGELRLTAEQEATFRPLLDEIAQQMINLPPASEQRMEVVRRYRPRMKALLRPEQHADFERFVRESEKRFQHTIRRQSRTNL